MSEAVCEGGVCKLPTKEEPEQKDDRVEYKGPKGKDPMQKLLGQKLQGKSGEVATSTLKDCDLVGLYFSAHWCPPCRGFTPKLAETYKKLKEDGKKFEIVFVSSDRDEESFKEYYGSMPWLALPFENRRRKGKLSKKFKVEGIPTFVLIDPKTGEVKNAEGVGAVRAGKEYPWVGEPTKSNLELLKEGSFCSGKEDLKFDDLVKDLNYLVLYFSAHWCPPCRGFTPKFAEWYKKNVDKLKGKENSFDVIFLSSDRDESAFDDYYKEMPWKAMKYKDRKGKEALGNNCGVQGIPSVVILDAKTGEIVNDGGRAGVMKDENAENFPWFPTLVNDVNEKPDALNDSPCLVFCLEKLEKAAQDEKIKILEEVAEGHKQRMEKNGEDPEFGFLYLKEKGGIGARLRGALGAEDADKDETKMYLVWFSSGKKFSYKEELTLDKVDALIKKMEDDYEKKIEWENLKK